MEIGEISGIGSKERGEEGRDEDIVMERGREEGEVG